MPGENFPGDRIVSLVDELEGLIEEAKPPFGKNAQFKVIDADVFFNILDEIRMSYPEEWQKSRRILKEREELMASAAAQADSIIADAQQQALTILLYLVLFMRSTISGCKFDSTGFIRLDTDDQNIIYQRSKYGTGIIHFAYPIAYGCNCPFQI